MSLRLRWVNKQGISYPLDSNISLFFDSADMFYTYFIVLYAYLDVFNIKGSKKTKSQNTKICHLN